MARILVIDDEPAVCTTIRCILEHGGHEVCSTTDSRRGLELFASFAPELTITDIVMPEVEGLETICSILGKDRFARVIAISGGERTRKTAFLKYAMGLGAVGKLEKPFEAEDLIETVHKCLMA